MERSYFVCPLISSMKVCHFEKRAAWSLHLHTVDALHRYAHTAVVTPYLQGFSVHVLLSLTSSNGEESFRLTFNHWTGSVPLLEAGGLELQSTEC